MPSRVAFRALLLLSLLAAALAACDSSDDGDPAAGTFAATLTGHTKTGLRGPAAFAVGTEGGQSLTGIGLFNSADDEDAVFVVLDGSPAVQRYAVADETAWALLVLRGTGAEGAFYLASGGSVTVPPPTPLVSRARST